MKTLVALLSLGVFGATAFAADRIYCQVEDRASQQQLAPRSKRLLLGKTQTLKPGGAFTFQAKCLERLATQYRLEFVLQRDEQPLAKVQVLMARDRPLTWQTPETIWRIWVD